jgi:hypothetical protein
MSNQEHVVLQNDGMRILSVTLDADLADRRRWKPSANHPWRQYRAVYLQKKHMNLVREQQVAECA